MFDFRRLACGLGAWAIATGALAQIPPDKPGEPTLQPAAPREPAALPEIKPSKVLEQPTADDVNRSFPARAAAAGVGGHAKVKCDVALSTRLENCRVIEEEPMGYGFGDAVIQVSRKYRVAPPSANGVSLTGETFTSSVNYRKPERAAAPPERLRAPGPSGPSTPMKILQRPTPEQVSDEYPARAMDHAISGKATVICEIAAGGSPEKCKVADESPPGYGFGDAAIHVASKFRVAPPTINGVAVPGAKFTLPVSFKLDEDRPRWRPPTFAGGPAITGSSDAPDAPPAAAPATAPKSRPKPVRSLDAIWAPSLFAAIALVMTAMALLAPAKPRRAKTPGQFA